MMTTTLVEFGNCERERKQTTRNSGLSPYALLLGHHCECSTPPRTSSPPSSTSLHHCTHCLSLPPLRINHPDFLPLPPPLSLARVIHVQRSLVAGRTSLSPVCNSLLSPFLKVLRDLDLETRTSKDFLSHRHPGLGRTSPPTMNQLHLLKPVPPRRRLQFRPSHRPPSLPLPCHSRLSTSAAAFDSASSGPVQRSVANLVLNSNSSVFTSALLLPPLPS